MEEREREREREICSAFERVSIKLNVLVCAYNHSVSIQGFAKTPVVAAATEKSRK